MFESLNRGSRTIVVLESTVYPGVTAQTWIPEIDDIGLEIGVDVEAYAALNKEKPLGRFNGFKTYIDRNHLAFEELNEAMDRLDDAKTVREVLIP